jgi:hypothetical protein
MRCRVESCDTLCTGGKCAWNACIDGDNDCLRQLAGAKCMVDPRWCPEAALRCAPCRGPDLTCPPNATCADKPSADGTRRCIPARAKNGDGAPTDLSRSGQTR